MKPVIIVEFKHSELLRQQIQLFTSSEEAYDFCVRYNEASYRPDKKFTAYATPVDPGEVFEIFRDESSGEVII